ncbi:hypothetical protein [Brevibacillus agri]|uniref:hypothetical protein n=1 Tax=Brevibacillus agri TaxID=51101 RepID=UPI003D1C43D4
MNLLEDLKRTLIKLFQQFDITVPRRQDTRYLLMCYLNLKSKLITPYPRKVHISFELANKEIASPFKEALDSIKVKIERGKDINPHLSKGIFKIEKPDDLLVDWGIYHLHLNTKKDKDDDYFYSRSDELLFFMSFENDIYFLEVLPHKQKDLWGNKEFLRIVNKNWPHLLEPFRIPDAISITPDLTEREIIDARKSGSLLLTEVDGNVYFPINGGLTTAKIAVRHVQMADSIISSIKELERVLGCV